MKKIIISLATVLFATSINATTIHTQDKTTSSYHTTGIERSVQVMYPTVSNNEYRTLVEVNTHKEENKAYIFLNNEKEMKSFKKYLNSVKNKFSEWKEIAEKNDVKDVLIPMNTQSPFFEIAWKKGNTWYQSGRRAVNFNFYVTPTGECFMVAGGTVCDWQDSSISKFWNLNFHDAKEFDEIISCLTIEKTEESKIKKLFK